MLKNRFITAGLTLALCAAILTSCGGNTEPTHSETESKMPLPGGKMSERHDHSGNGIENGINNVKNDVKQGVENVKNGMDGMEDATHGTARQDGHDNDTEAETAAPEKEHRPAAPKGK